MIANQIPIGTIHNSLKAGHTTAQAIRQATGLSLESVYTALVWLEARGQAFLSCSRKTGGYVARWETQ